MAVKKEPGKNFISSALSKTHTSPTTVFNIGKTTGNQQAQPGNSDELRFQTYLLPEDAYLKMNFTLERQEDQKFSYFDCYVVMAVSPNKNYVTLNYYDKTNFRLLMTIYPTGRKTLYKEYTFKDSILVHTEILHVDESNNASVSTVEKIDFNDPRDQDWFLSYDVTAAVPTGIKTGKFKPKHGEASEMLRTKDTQTDIYNNGKSKIVTSLKWISDNIFNLITDSIINAPGNLKPGDEILVKIVACARTKYLCHYTSKYGTGTRVYLKVE